MNKIIISLLYIILLTACSNKEEELKTTNHPYKIDSKRE